MILSHPAPHRETDECAVPAADGFRQARSDHCRAEDDAEWSPHYRPGDEPGQFSPGLRQKAPAPIFQPLPPVSDNAGSARLPPLKDHAPLRMPEPDSVPQKAVQKNVRKGFAQKPHPDPPLLRGCHGEREPREAQNPAVSSPSVNTRNPPRRKAPRSPHPPGQPCPVPGYNLSLYLTSYLSCIQS